MADKKKKDTGSKSHEGADYYELPDAPAPTEDDVLIEFDVDPEFMKFCEFMVETSPDYETLEDFQRHAVYLGVLAFGVLLETGKRPADGPEFYRLLWEADKEFKAGGDEFLAGFLKEE